MDNELSTDERVLRAAFPSCIKKNGEISSTAFKPRKRGGVLEGVSVERTSGRTLEASIEFLLDHMREDSRVLAVLTQWCDDNDIEVRDAPSRNNPYHAELYIKQLGFPLDAVRYKALAKNAKIVR